MYWLLTLGQAEEYRISFGPLNEWLRFCKIGPSIKISIMTTPPSKKRRTTGRVFIGSMNMRGAWAVRPNDSVSINVTSAQSKTSQNRLDFSPMTQTNYNGYHCFENYWQSGKKFEGISLEKSKAWWAKQIKGKRRYPAGKGKEVLCSNYDGIERGYIDSRKEIYVPEYDTLMRVTESFSKYKTMIEKGQDVVVMDFDGPRTPERGVCCEEVTLELLKEKINDVKFPFGHGYVVAAGLKGYDIKQYI